MYFKYTSLFIIVVIFSIHDVYADNAEQKCGKNDVLLKAAPGKGWDSLQSKEMASIYNIKLSKCSKTSDNKFMLVDGVISTSINKRKLEVDVITDWSKFIPMTGKSLKIESMKDNILSEIDGFFTDDYRNIKKHQLTENYATVRVILRNVVYKLSMDKSSTLNEKFKDNVGRISYELQEDNFKGARYFSDILVRDYGTHFISDIDVGGLFVHDDYVNAQFAEKYEELVKDMAQALFVDAYKLDIDSKSTASAENFTTYELFRKGFSTYTIGGPKYVEDMDVNDWESGLLNDLTVVDYSGITLDSAVKMMTPILKGLSHELLVDFVKEAVEKYYRINTHKGCSAEDAIAFDGTVNYFAGGICSEDYQELYLGGFYQTCLPRGRQDKDYCNNYTFTNEISGSNACPDTYSDESSLNMEIIHECSLLSNDRMEKCIVDVSTRICLTAVEPSDETKTFAFGGVYSAITKNIITKAANCPQGFEAIGVIGDGFLFICVSQVKTGRAITGEFSFGGLCNNFDRCPTKSCPPGYTQHFGTLIEENEIYYCARILSNDLQYEVELVRPPYVELAEQIKPNKVVKNKPIFYFLVINVIIGLLLDL